MLTLFCEPKESNDSYFYTIKVYHVNNITKYKTSANKAKGLTQDDLAKKADIRSKVPSGTYGIVMDVKVLVQKRRMDQSNRVSPSKPKKHAKQVEEEFKTKMDELGAVDRSSKQYPPR